MAKTHACITEELRAFIEAQAMFFVASAPLDGEGHVNLSPKGLDALRIMGTARVAYLDMTGSGNETSAHVLENGRITFMFCAFTGAPLILRLYGRGRTVLPDTAEWEALYPLFDANSSARQIIVADITRVQTSCGFGVPLYAYEGQRETIARWAEAKGPAGLEEYRQAQNRESIDGLPTALAAAPDADLA